MYDFAVLDLSSSIFQYNKGNNSGGAIYSYFDTIICISNNFLNPFFHSFSLSLSLSLSFFLIGD